MDLMVCANPFNIKSSKEVDQDTGYGDYMKSCDSSKNFVDNISSFECFATKKKN